MTTHAPNCLVARCRAALDVKHRFTIVALTRRPRLRHICALVLFVSSAIGCHLDVSPKKLAGEKKDSEAPWSPTEPRTTSRRQETAAVDRQNEPTSSGDASADDRMGGSAVAAVPDAGRPVQPVISIAGSGGGAAGGISGAGQTASPVAGSGGDRDAATPAAVSALCTPGSYQGEFTGSVTFFRGTINEVTGTISAEMVFDPSAADHMSIQNGKIVGANDQNAKMAGTWTGSVNCKTERLENVQQEGEWDTGTRYEGTLQGMYSPEDNTMVGTWEVDSPDAPLLNGNGDWEMVLRSSANP